MFASLDAHLERKTTLRRRLRKEFHAGRLIKEIKRVNPGYFPVRIREAPDKQLAFDEVDTSDTSVYLPEHCFIQMYEKVCGLFAHAQRRDVYGSENDMRESAGECRRFLVRLRNRWIYHAVFLPDGSHVICGTHNTNPENEGAVYVAFAVPKSI